MRPRTLASGLLAFLGGLATVEWVALAVASVALALACYSLWIGEQRARRDDEWREQQAARAEALEARLHGRLEEG